MDRRSSQRRFTNVDTIAATDFARIPARIVNVSQGGCLLSTPARLRLGERIGLELVVPLQDAKVPNGRVVWSGPRAAGMEFDSALAAEVLARLTGDVPDGTPIACKVIRLDEVRASRATGD